MWECGIDGVTSSCVWWHLVSKIYVLGLVFMVSFDWDIKISGGVTHFLLPPSNFTPLYQGYRTWGWMGGNMFWTEIRIR